MLASKPTEKRPGDLAKKCYQVMQKAKAAARPVPKHEQLQFDMKELITGRR